MNTIFKYIPEVGDRVKIVGNFYSLIYTQDMGKVGEIKGVDKRSAIAEVEIEVDAFNKKVIRACFEDLQFISRDIKPKCPEDTDFKLTIQNDEPTEPIEKQEPIELDHLCMPTTQDEIEPIDKGEVVEEVGKFVKFLKSKGWSLDSLNIELCNQDDNEDYVIVHL